MELFDVKHLARNAAVEAEVERAIETIREVEKLGGKRSEYNLARPFSRLQPWPREVESLGSSDDPRTVKLNFRRK